MRLERLGGRLAPVPAYYRPYMDAIIIGWTICTSCKKIGTSHLVGCGDTELTVWSILTGYTNITDWLLGQCPVVTWILITIQTLLIDWYINTDRVYKLSDGLWPQYRVSIPTLWSFVISLPSRYTNILIDCPVNTEYVYKLSDRLLHYYRSGIQAYWWIVTSTQSGYPNLVIVCYIITERVYKPN
jgi:hypothetical protein